MTIKEVFEKYKTVAVFGMSKNSSKAANYVPTYLREQGYMIIPINPSATQIDGLTAYPNIADVPDRIEILNVFRPSEEALDVVKEAIERHKAKGDIDLIWLQEGIINDEAKAIALENGIEFIQDKCMLREHKYL